MTTRSSTPPRRRLLAARRAGAGVHGEDGFILLESIVAISLITIILAALGTFTLRSVSATNQLRARQAATQVATTAMTDIDATPAADLIYQHDQSSVDATWNSFATNATVNNSLAYMNREYDTVTTPLAAGAGANAPIPTTTKSVTLNSTPYAVTIFVGSCTIPTGQSACVKSGTGVKHFRVVVAVTWTGSGCSSGSSGCTFVTSTLVNSDADPVFNTNRATPPATPIVVNPGDQKSTLGGSVSLQLTIKPGTGVGAPTWTTTAGALPNGLTMSGSGLISGTPGALQSATSVTVTATDLFGRTGSATFNWTVVGPPTITTPATQTTRSGTAVTLNIASTCPNSACTFAVSGAPAGLSIDANTGVISGTPTTVGTSSNVVVTITDAAGVAVSTNPFTWIITSRATISDPGTRNVTIGQNVSVPITFSCPTTRCTITVTGTVPGVGLTASSTQTGNNTTTSGTVNSGSGTTYLAGTVQSNAVTSGSSKAYSLLLTITDANNQSTTSAVGPWTAYVAPTVSGLVATTVKVLQTPSVELPYTCPIASCTLTLTSTVPGLGLSTTANATAANSTTSLTVTATSGSVYYTGKVDTAAVPSGYSATYTPKVTITDADTVAASTTATWTVNKAPLLTNPGTQVLLAGQNLAIQMSTTCPNGGCTNWSAAALPAGQANYIAIPISNAGLISYNNAPAGTYTIRVTVSDSAGQSDTVYFTLKVVNSVTLNVPDQTTTKPTTGSTTVTLDASTMINPAGDSYVWSLSGAPSWLTIDSSTGLMTATITSASQTDTSITVTARSTAGSGTSATDTFSWTLR